MHVIPSISNVQSGVRFDEIDQAEFEFRNFLWYMIIKNLFSHKHLFSRFARRTRTLSKEKDPNNYYFYFLLFFSRE